MNHARPPAWLGLVSAGSAVASTTLAVYPLREVATDISLSVVYLLAVLFIATLWGVWLGIATAVASALAFNFFHIVARDALMAERLLDPGLSGVVCGQRERPVGEALTQLAE